MDNLGNSTESDLANGGEINGELSLQGDLDMNGNDILDAGTIHYTALNPPVGGGGGYTPNKVMKSDNGGTLVTATGFFVDEDKNNDETLRIENGSPRIEMINDTNTTASLDFKTPADILPSQISFRHSTPTDGRINFVVLGNSIFTINDDEITFSQRCEFELNVLAGVGKLTNPIGKFVWDSQPNVPASTKGLGTIAIGSSSLSNNTTIGTDNVCIGVSSGSTVTDGKENVCLGVSSGSKITTGSQNIYLGANSGVGLSNITTNGNIALGPSSFADGGNTICIGFNAGNSTSNTAVIGRNITSMSCQTIGCDLGTNSIRYNNLYLSGNGLMAGLTTSADVQMGTGSLQHTGNAVQFLGIGPIQILNSNTCSITPTGTLTLKAHTTTGEIDMSSNKIVNVLDPTDDQDASTKKYVDDSVIPSFWALNWGGNVTTQAPRYLTYSNSASTGFTDASVNVRNVYFNPKDCYFVGYSMIRQNLASQTAMYITIEDSVGSGTYTDNLLEIFTPADNTQVKRRFPPTPLFIGDQIRIGCFIDGSLANPQNCSVTFYFSYENTPVALSRSFIANPQITDMGGSESLESRIVELEQKINALTSS